MFLNWYYIKNKKKMYLADLTALLAEGSSVCRSGAGEISFDESSVDFRAAGGLYVPIVGRDVFDFRTWLLLVLSVSLTTIVNSLDAGVVFTLCWRSSFDASTLGKRNEKKGQLQQINMLMKINNMWEQIIGILDTATEI